MVKTQNPRPEADAVGFAAPEDLFSLARFDEFVSARPPLRRAATGDDDGGRKPGGGGLMKKKR